MKAEQARIIASESEMGKIYDKIRQSAENGHFTLDIKLNQDQCEILLGMGYGVSYLLSEVEYAGFSKCGAKANVTIDWSYTTFKN